MRPIKFRVKCVTGDKPWHYFTFPLLSLELLETAYDLDTWTQFTGLHDKNGKEIWEGDVVRDGNKDLWVIRYSNEDIGFVFQNPTDKSNYNTMSWLQTNDLRQNEDSIFEVIGNIYENPELINHDK